MVFWDSSEGAILSDLHHGISLDDISGKPEEAFYGFAAHVWSTFTARTFRDPQRMFKLRYPLLKQTFTKLYHLDPSFDFALYRRRCFADDVTHVIEIRWYTWLTVLVMPAGLMAVDFVLGRPSWFTMKPGVIYFFIAFGWFFGFMYYSLAYYIERLTYDKYLQARMMEVLKGPAAVNLKESLLPERLHSISVVIQFLKLLSAFYLTLIIMSLGRGCFDLFHPGVATLLCVLLLAPGVCMICLIQPVIMQGWSTFKGIFELRKNILR